MNNNIFYQFLIIFITLSLIIAEKKVKKKKTKINPQKHNKEDEITSLYKWAEKNNIFINDKLNLNKKLDSSHNFYYFTSNDSIKNDTVLLRVPYEIMISQSSLEKHFKEKGNKKFSLLWNKILEHKNPHISYFSTKQFLYMAIIIEDSINKKKGSLYQKYKPYFDMYEYMNLDNFPVFYDEEEKYYLSPSSLGYELNQAIESLKEEYYIVKNDLQISTPIEDDFLKYRVLTLANSLSFNDTNFNQSAVIPFLDCFNKVVFNINASAEYSFKKDNNSNYYFEIKAIRDISKNEEIYLKWMKLSNNDCLIYYGFIEKENNLAPTFYIYVFNNLFKQDMGIDTKKEFNDIMDRGLYELNTELFNPDVIGSYKNLSELFDKYKNKPEGKYEMMADNLKYYLDIYDTQFSDGNINLYLKGNKKIDYIKTIMKLEKRLIQNKINYIKKVIKDIQEGKNDPLEDL